MNKACTIFTSVENTSTESGFDPTILLIILGILVVIGVAILLIFYFRKRTIKLMYERIDALKEAEDKITEDIIAYQKLYFDAIDALKKILPEEADSVLDACNPNGDISSMTIEEKEEILGYICYGFKILHSLANFYEELRDNEEFSTLIDDSNYKLSLIDASKSVYNSKIYSYNSYLGRWPTINLAPKYNLTKKELFEYEEAKKGNIRLDSDDEDEFEEAEAM